MQNAEQIIRDFEAGTMDYGIKLIERITQREVYVGCIAGTDYQTIYACVDVPWLNARLQCPGETEAEAVASLFSAVFPEAAA